MSAINPLLQPAYAWVVLAWTRSDDVCLSMTVFIQWPQTTLPLTFYRNLSFDMKKKQHLPLSLPASYVGQTAVPRLFDLHRSAGTSWFWLRLPWTAEWSHVRYSYTPMHVIKHADIQQVRVSCPLAACVCSDWSLAREAIKSNAHYELTRHVAPKRSSDSDRLGNTRLIAAGPLRLSKLLY